MQKILSLQERLNNFTGDYVSNYPKMTLYRLSRLLPYFSLEPDDIIVDYACGSGMLAEIIHGLVQKYVGVDFSSEFIALATERTSKLGIRNARFKTSDIVDFAKANEGVFDKAFAMDFAETIYDDEFRKIFKAALSSLKSGGTLYIHEPNGAFFVERLRDFKLLPRTKQVVAVRTAKQLERMLNEVGFCNIQIRMLAHYEMPFSFLHPLSKLPGLGKLFEARTFIRADRP